MVGRDEEVIAAEVLGVAPQFFPGPILNVPLGRKNDPSVGSIPDSSEVASGDTQGGQCANKSRAVIVISHGPKLGN